MLFLSLYCPPNSVDHSSNILGRIHNKMITRNLLSSRLHSIVDFPSCFRVTLSDSCVFSGQKSLPHHFGGNLQPRSRGALPPLCLGRGRNILAGAPTGLWRQNGDSTWGWGKTSRLLLNFTTSSSESPAILTIITVRRLTCQDTVLVQYSAENGQAQYYGSSGPISSLTQLC